MAESETSSSILIVWLAWEHCFAIVVLWPTPNGASAASPDREMMPAGAGSGRSWDVAPNNNIFYS